MNVQSELPKLGWRLTREQPRNIGWRQQQHTIRAPVTTVVGNASSRLRSKDDKRFSRKTGVPLGSACIFTVCRSERFPQPVDSRRRHPRPPSKPRVLVLVYCTCPVCYPNPGIAFVRRSRFESRRILAPNRAKKKKRRTKCPTNPTPRSTKRIGRSQMQASPNTAHCSDSMPCWTDACLASSSQHSGMWSGGWLHVGTLRGSLAHLCAPMLLRDTLLFVCLLLVCFNFHGIAWPCPPRTLGARARNWPGTWKHGTDIEF
ncbi:hypothetical protein B0T26DRAFT_312514 [Lasiosphaeria miniovina]|uniref:Uncharacterized protein n=1 Tax=Lasiosphaeria miniovina TaxID=1954250 RepID=A0AA40ALM5_9PEZI|nr:uncharacterized protein B0T26DRAFT_312514 [Lasiosphaeria miniovina]KAK0718094.1 hypothetical protein B0T26DRAFT_312514 [Lasiosphaeria miniovina]